MNEDAGKVRLKDLSDEDVLLALLEHPSELTKAEKTNFEAWANRIQQGNYLLSSAQKRWARDKFGALELEKTFNAENLASAQKSWGTKADTASQQALESVMGPKVLQPPPSSRRNYAATKSSSYRSYEETRD